MISDELLNKFDRIEDLPVSEEMLGAYMENKLDSFETSQIESAISEGTQLSEFVDEISQDNGFNILDNLDSQLFAPISHVFIDGLQLPNLDSDFANVPFQEDDLVAACCSENLCDDLDGGLSDDSFISDHLDEENLSREDSFLGSDQSLDIDSHESEDMFDEESIDL